MPKGPMPIPEKIRFERHYVPEPNSGCWLWTGQATRYGHWWRNRSVKTTAHRASYELHVGPIPRDMEIHHKCSTPMCVNPEHLTAVTPSEHRRFGRPRRRRCNRGHILTGGNVLIEDKSGSRRCKTCRQAQRKSK